MPLTLDQDELRDSSSSYPSDQKGFFLLSAWSLLLPLPTVRRSSDATRVSQVLGGIYVRFITLNYLVYNNLFTIDKIEY